MAILLMLVARYEIAVKPVYQRDFVGTAGSCTAPDQYLHKDPNADAISVHQVMVWGTHTILRKRSSTNRPPRKELEALAGLH
jgi:hypothetical protein